MNSWNVSANRKTQPASSPSAADGNAPASYLEMTKHEWPDNRVEEIYIKREIASMAGFRVNKTKSSWL
jgi:hypothetical protein